MDKLGYLQHFDYSQLPNVKKNLIPALRHPAADPKRPFTIPWQSGMTGLIVRDDLAPGVDSINDLYDPKYKGKVSLLTEMRDSVPMTLKAMGIDPAQATEDQWLRRWTRSTRRRSSGQVRKFTGNEYIKDLPKGDTWIALGWSGDAIQLQKDNPNIKFVMPKEGCMLWSTSMEIPVGAPNAPAAQAFINFVYDPKVQADIAEWVNYVTPVQGREGDPREARSRAREEPADLPERGLHGQLQLRARARRRSWAGSDRGVPARDRRVVRPLSIAALQTSPVFGDPEATLRRMGERVARLRGVVPHVRLVMFPELHLPACRRRSSRTTIRPTLAVDVPGPLTESSARSPGRTASGSCRARCTSAPRTAACTTRPGPLARGRARGQLPKVFPWQPHESSAPGDRFVTFDMPEVGRLGLSICYDGSFPETCRELAWMGAEVVLQVSLTTTSDRPRRS